MSGLGGRRILVVDDEPGLLFAIADAMIAEGAVVHACSTGADALEALRDEGFDLVITDIRMPGVDGLVVGAAAASRGTRVVYMSADRRSLAQVAGAETLEKPFALRTLLKLVLRTT